jgi:DNA end-binding protein Ku
MVLETLRYDDELNKAASYFRTIGDAKPDDDLLDLASTLIDKKSGEFDAGDFHNRYVDALKDLIEKKIKNKGARIETEEADEKPSRGGNVIDLMAALKKSLDKPGAGPADAANDRKPARKPATRKAPAKAAPARKPAARKRA